MLNYFEIDSVLFDKNIIGLELAIDPPLPQGEFCTL